MKGIAKKCAAGTLIAVMLFATAGCGAGEPESVQGQSDSSGVLEKPDKTWQKEDAEETEQTEAAKETAQADPSAYDGILEGLYAIISNPDEADYEDVPGAMGVWEAARDAGDDALNALGYTIKDISGDGVPELMVGTVEGETWVRAVYTLADGEPQLVLEGWNRNQYGYDPSAYDSKGVFFCYGSNGASSSCTGTYTITQDGIKLECLNFYFTALDEDSGDIRVYHNTTGSWDPAQSEEVPEDEYWRMDRDLSDCEWSPTLFSSLGMDVSVQWLEDAGPLEDYDECSIALGEEPLSKIAFIPKRPVEEFCVLSLTVAAVSESGDIEFEAYPEACSDDNRLERPLVAEVSFTGDLPEYGFQYEDKNGNMRRFAIEISGRDGSLVVREADPEYFSFVLKGGGEMEAYSDRIPVLTYGRLPYDDMEEIAAEDHHPDGGYYYENMIVGGTASVIRCAYQSMREELGEGLEDYITDCAENLTIYETKDVHAEKNEAYSENLGYPVYIVQFTTGGNEDTRFWTVYGTEANGYIYLYAFNIWADAEWEHDRVWEVFDELMFSD